MNIIPVIDLKNGQVVHAQQGNRQHYQPINSPLCQSANIHEVLKAFLSVYEFTNFYIADLNAITGQGNHDELITQLVEHYPQFNFWVDKGYQHYSHHASNYYPVLGSECYQDSDIDVIKAFNKRFILSLDYNASGQLGSQRLFNDSSLWSETVIIMSLYRVGSFQGADIEKLSAFCKHYPEKKFVAAGGIRDSNDLAQLKAIGINQALIASALHSKAIQREQIESLIK
ncbi:MAG: HisA/HisF-related TIM barrel protein [Methylococcaceae bacterium]